MKRDAENEIRAQRQPSSEKGFSILELVIVALLIFIVTGMAVIQLEPAWQQIQANAGLDQVKSTLRQAREMAISERRDIVVQFVNVAANTPCVPVGNILSCVMLTQMQVVAGVPPAPNTQVLAPAPFTVVPIEGNVTFLTFTNEPDTPDAFVGAAPVAPAGLYVNGAAGIPAAGLMFQSDGTFTNGTNPVNVTIFLGEKNIPTTARAITVLGNTGKVTGYQGTGLAWFR